MHTTKVLFAVLCLSAFSATVFAHHSVAGFFNPDETVEIAGVIRKVRWRNPHTVFEVDVTNARGETVAWQIESGALGVLRSRGLGREFVQPGDHVNIMGDKSLRSNHQMFARNMLLKNGKEVLLTAGSKPYFLSADGGDFLEPEFDTEATAAARESADGIFRVWSSNIDDRSSDRLKMFAGDYPLLESARKARAEYDAGDQALLGCTRWSMPRIMANPLPMEFARSGKNIVQRFEEDDNVRTIYIHAEGEAAAVAHSGVSGSTMGYSTGYWKGDTLLVETTYLSPDRLDDLGTPTSAELHLLERFSLSKGDSQLDYQLTITDPNTLVNPIQMGRHWDWRPEIVVGRYACEEDQQLR